ncbi:AAA family ATPase, partial [Sphingomonas sp.]|uniref:AAA family ATPase n=1 Tax=Sphingomonas sp. TaxID=28214 RepID=UPI0025CE51DD
AREALAGTENELREARHYQATLAHELQVATRAKERLLAEQTALAAPVELPEEADVEGVERRRDSLVAQLASSSADSNLAKQRLQEAQKGVDEAKTRLANSERRLESIRQAETTRGRRLGSLGPDRIRWTAEIERCRADLTQQDALQAQTKTILSTLQGQRDEQMASCLALGQQAKNVRANVAAIAGANHQAELGRARAESRRAAAEERLLEEYGISAQDALVQAPAIEVPPDAAPLAGRLRRELRAMGMVNIGADEAYERLTGRHDELTAQRADILEGIEQVQASMSELDKLTRDQFLDTFAKVQVAYGEMFQKLFGGGEGKMFLDNPSSILESGIEIEVQLPGKKKQRLELLSGGERALCASGFLFALLSTKPSPLVVLDEVDAPLDGRNVERFADVLVEFSKITQFIVITHNPTTIERAPVWLGVTMNEPGVSTLVPARMPMPETAVVQVAAQPSLRLSPAT